MVALKLIPQLLSWIGIVLVLLRGFPGRRSIVTAASISGFVIGLAGALLDQAGGMLGWQGFFSPLRGVSGFP